MKTTDSGGIFYEEAVILLVNDVDETDPITGQQIFPNVNFNLDVAGDGTVGAFSDGFMVLRKMFGDAFAGEALTNKAITTTATRSTTEIHEYIQEGIDSKILDVDGDGEVGAFSDGFMILRKMFGDAFAGEALTNKAITDSATRETDEIHDYIADLSTIDPIA